MSDHERGVTVTQAAIDKEFAAARQKEFPAEGDYLDFLKNTHQTEDDLKLRVRLKLLTEELRPSLQAEAGDPKTMQEKFIFKWRRRLPVLPISSQMIVAIAST